MTLSQFARPLALLMFVAIAADAAEMPPIWAAKCKGCHGDDGRGDTKMGRKHKVNDFSQARWQTEHTDEALADAIANGVPDTKMKSYKDVLSPSEIARLVTWIRSLKAP